MVERLKAVLSEHAIALTPSFDGQFQRNGSQWGKGTEIDGVPVYFYGDFKRDLSAFWVGAELTPEQQAAFSQRIREVQGENRAAREEAWSAERILVGAEWDTFTTLGTSSYAQRKGFKGLYGCRIEAHQHGARLIVPARDVDGKLWGYQRIYSEKLSEIGTDKLFRKGARKEGCFHTLGELKDGSLIVLSEGISTAVALYESLEREVPVVSVFDAGNLTHVAQALRSKYPSSPLRIGADDDQSPGKDGKIHHTGEKKAQDACEKTQNCQYALPSGLVAGESDFWDLWHRCGAAAVKDALFREPKGQGQHVGPPTPKMDKPSAGAGEAQLVKALLSRYRDDDGPTLIRQGKDFFRYEGTHWVPLDPLATPDQLKAELDHIAGGKLKFKDIASAYQRFCIHMPTPPPGIDLFAPNPFAQNFANGTVHLLPRPDGTFDIVQRPHRRTDYLIHCHGFDYREDAAPNPEFEAALDRIWAGEPDIETKKQAYFEVLGACLIPAFRKLVLFVGKPKSGKSTLVLFAAHMMDPRYRCSVDPTQFHGFNLESMAGKLLNFDTDINLLEPITDSILKKIEDRLPMRIRRKGVADIYAPIPAMHLFAANRMPVSAEGGQAYDRRMLIFRCEKYQPPGKRGYTQDYAQLVWKQDCQGIVRRAIEGLKRLAEAGGHFTIPESSEAEILAWQKGQGDLVQDFLQDLDLGEITNKQNKVLRHDKARLKRSDMWEIFKAWCDSSAPRNALIGKYKFYDRLRQLGIEERPYEGVFYFQGIGLGVGEESDV